MRSLALLALLAVAAAPPAKSPDCADWPLNIAETKLKNAGLLNIDLLDKSKTKLVKLASEKIGKDLYQQIYDITLFQTDGKAVEVITNSQSSSKECSMSGVRVFVVAKDLGDL
jgi:hypothetical protein